MILVIAESYVEAHHLVMPTKPGGVGGGGGGGAGGIGTTRAGVSTSRARVGTSRVPELRSAVDGNAGVCAGVTTNRPSADKEEAGKSGTPPCSSRQ